MSTKLILNARGGGKSLCLSPEQWARAGEATLRAIYEAQGLPVTDEDVREARDAAVHIATGKRVAS